MQNWANRAVLGTAVLVAGTAWATPPRVISVTDTLFGRNADTLFLLREVRDNHGLHQVMQLDTLLISRSLSDGGDRGFASVERVIDFGPDMPERARDHTPESAVNPYAFRADAQAWPLADPARPIEAEPIGAEGLRLTGFDNATYALALSALQAHIEDTLISVRGVQPALQVMSDPDPFDPYLFDIMTDCSLTGTSDPLHAPGDPLLAQVTCEDEDTLQFARLWVVVPKM